MRRRPRTSDERRWRSLSIIKYFAEAEKHTIADAEKEFNLSKQTIREDIEYFRTLLYIGAFNNSPSKKKFYIFIYYKAKNRLQTNRGNADNARRATEKKLEKLEMKKDLEKSSQKKAL